MPQATCVSGLFQEAAHTSAGQRARAQFRARIPSEDDKLVPQLAILLSYLRSAARVILRIQPWQSTQSAPRRLLLFAAAYCVASRAFFPDQTQAANHRDGCTKRVVYRRLGAVLCYCRFGNAFEGPSGARISWLAIFQPRRAVEQFARQASRRNREATVPATQ